LGLLNGIQQGGLPWIVTPLVAKGTRALLVVAPQQLVNPVTAVAR
jgi:hypothetical protein